MIFARQGVAFGRRPFGRRPLPLAAGRSRSAAGRAVRPIRAWALGPRPQAVLCAGAAQRLSAGAGRVCKKHFSRMQKTFLRNMQKTFFPHAEGMFPAAMGRVALATVVIAKPQQDNADHSGIVRG